MNEYDQFEAEMIDAGKSLEEIERLWNTPTDPFDSEYRPLGGVPELV